MLILFFGLIFGMIMGSFINSAVWRVHEKKFSYTDRSRCVSCLRVLSWYQNIPICSFVWFRGICLFCKKKIPLDYLLVEIFTGILGLFLCYFHVVQDSLFSVLFFRDAVILCCLVYIFVYDAKYMEILNRVTILPAIFLTFASVYFGWQDFWTILWGVLVGGGFFLAQYVFSQGKWVGGGDVRMGLFMGVILGWPNILCALLLSYVLGALFGVWLLAHRKGQLGTSVPFGTFLAIGTLVTHYYGDLLVSWYISLLV